MKNDKLGVERESWASKGRHLGYAIQFPCEGGTGWLVLCQDFLWVLSEWLIYTEVMEMALCLNYTSVENNS